MSERIRKRRRLHWPITISITLMTLNIALMVGWILFAAEFQEWGGLAIGTITFAVILIGLTFYMVLTIKEVRVSWQQANFVDSVTHELKTPIASLRLYLETLQLRELEDARRADFYRTMEHELVRLDTLISQLLEVGRLDALGDREEFEELELDQLLRKCGQTACAHHKCDDTVVKFDVAAAIIHGKRLLLDMIFTNLIDNAIKYGGVPPEVIVHGEVRSRNRVLVRITDNGQGVPSKMRKKIFRIFFRVGSELERRGTGTGLGLYIVRTLVKIMKGTINVRDREDGPGTVFEVELPGRALA